MRFLGSLLGCLLAFTGQAQYTHQWINHSQTYYRIKLSQTGLYRLSFQELKDAGVPVEGIDPRLLQLYHRGQEQAILFKHNQQPANSVFEDGEYFEFYGQRNDGTRDAALYQPASLQPHSFYNLYSDSSAYFLTWSNGVQQGKRMEAIDLVNSTNLPKENHHLNEVRSVYTSNYSVGATFNTYIQQSFFDEGEGWTGPIICTINSGCTGQQDFAFDQLTQPVQSAGLPKLEIQLAGRDVLPHQAEIYVGPNAGSLRLVATQSFFNFETPVVVADLAWSDIAADGRLTVRVKALGVGGLRERISVSYIRIFHPQAFDLQNAVEKRLTLAPNAGGRSYLELLNPTASTRIFDITNTHQVATIGTRSIANGISAVVPNTTQSRQLLVTSQFFNATATHIRKVSFRQIDPDQANYLIVSHQRLMFPALGYSNPVRSFAAYRASEEGGGYDTLTVDMDLLYNQFNYGETSPVAIYEFMKFMVEQGAPRYLFLIGKGREVQADFHRKTSVPANEYRDLVPTAGTPASDMLFTAGLAGTPHVAAVATGRLTASTPEEVAVYLNKVREAESTPFNDLWHKRILHLSGGIQENELPKFKQYMDGFAAVAEGLYAGAQVSTVAKHSPEQVQFINVTNEVNAGLNLITFFGHSSSNATDIDIGYASDPLLGYRNAGRYPALLVNGCNAGEFFNNGKNFGEDWILSSNKGARNFIANSSFGYDGPLRLYTEYFYQVAFGDQEFFDRGIGEVQMEVARRFLSVFSNPSPLFVAQTQQMVLLGDPALRVFGASKTDYEVTNEGLFITTFDGKPWNALSDSIQLNMIVKNFGRVAGAPLHVAVTHTLNGTVSTITQTYEPVYFQDTLRLVIRRGDGNFFGENRLDVLVDADGAAEELNEENNRATISATVLFNGTKNLLPADYGVVTDTAVELIFQNTSSGGNAATYLVEIDTTHHFNSAYLQTRTIEGGLLNRVPVELLPKDSTVYYWRTKLANDGAAQWEKTSFVFIQNGENGWAQLAGAQLANNPLHGLVRDATAFQLDYETNHVSVFVKTFGSTNAASHLTGSFQVNDAEFYFSPQGFNCRDNTINLVAFNKTSLVPYRGVPFTFANSFGRACGREPQIINSFLPAETDTGNGDDLVQYVNNITAGDSVIVFSMGDAGATAWSALVKAKLEEFGIAATVWDQLLPGEPFIFLGKKGAEAGSAKLIRSELPDPQGQELQLTEELSGKIPVGSMRSVVVGPSLHWKSLLIRTEATQPTDSIRVDVHGIRVGGQEEELLSAVSFNQSLEEIDAATYPYLRLSFFTQDEEGLTATDIRHWFVLYDPAPEGMVFLNGSAEPQTLQEGVSWSAPFGFTNISTAAFPDSVQVDVLLFNQPTATVTTQRFRIKSPAPGDTSVFSVTTDTRSRVGWNDVRVSVNRSGAVEQFLPNNTVAFEGLFEVVPDRVPPVLDVTVDGRYLMNGDFVSPSPLITVTLKDENTFVPLDTTGFQMFLRYPCAEACEPQRIFLKRTDVTWQVSPDGKELKVDFRPATLPEGEYELWVQGADKSGNLSGNDFYRVNFNVLEAATAALLAPYPNPSESGFYFEFKLSGSEPPTRVLLQLFNSQGQLLQEFTQNDFEPLRVGFNRLHWLPDSQQEVPSAAGLLFYRFELETGGQKLHTTGKLMRVH